MGFFAADQDDTPAVWSVEELNGYIRDLFEVDYRLQDIEVAGEISNFTRARSGHLYFTLKDEDAQLKCVMWRSNADRLRFRPQDGDAVVARGRVSVYEAGGVYQLYADRLRPSGRGDLALAFEELKERLDAEGLFDEEHKRPLPPLPTKIGLVTSLDAAALRDILHVLRRRYPVGQVLIAPALVQGRGAADQIARAITWLDGRDDVDVIIVSRGGGSMEDLWAFNEEPVARAIFASRYPVISGVGHETDFTIADFVADVRAPTPSAAAEIVAPDLSHTAEAIAGTQQILTAALWGRLDEAQRRVRELTRTLHLLGPGRRMDGDRQRLDGLTDRLERAIGRRLEHHHTRTDMLAVRLNAVSPLATLERGYAIVRAVDGTVLRRTADLSAGQSIRIQLADGTRTAVVDDDPAQTDVVEKASDEK